MLPISQVADRLRVPRTTLWRVLRRHGLPIEKRGAHWYVDNLTVAKVEQLLQHSKTGQRVIIGSPLRSPRR